jgi:hypothetical protein
VEYSNAILVKELKELLSAVLALDVGEPPRRSLGEGAAANGDNSFTIPIRNDNRNKRLSTYV